jgi:hypothetical protein
VKPTGAAVAAACLVALAAATPARAQLLGLDWGLSTRNDYQVIDVAGESELRSLDAFDAKFEAWQQAGPVTIRYLASGGFGVSPQRGRISASADREVIAYPGPSGVRISWPPRGAGEVLLALEGGRLALSDPTGLLFTDPRALSPAQLADGLRLEARFARTYAELEVGTTGLLDRDVNRVRMTASDARDAAEDGLAPRRLLATMGIQTTAIGSQNTGLYVVVQQDLRGGDDTLSSYYFGPIGEGALPAGIAWSSALIGAWSVDASGSVGPSILASVRLSHDIPLDILETGWLRVRWASSDGGGLAAFPALAGPLAATVYREPLSDLVDVQLGADARLAVPPRGARIEPALSLSAIFAPSGRAAASSSITPNGAWAGAEATLGVRYLIEDDFALQLDGAWHFIDGEVRAATGLVMRITL